MDLWEEEAALGTLARRTHRGAWLLRVSRVGGTRVACGAAMLWSQVVGAPAGFALLASCCSLALCPAHQCQQVPTCAGRYLRPTRCLRPCVPCSRVPGLTRGPWIPGGLQAVGLGGFCSPPARVLVLPAGPVRLADLGGPSCRFLSSWVLPQEPPLAWGFLQELRAHWPG